MGVRIRRSVQRILQPTYIVLKPQLPITIATAYLYQQVRSIIVGLLVKRMQGIVKIKVCISIVHTP